jgi:hypothetical protein
LARGWKRLHNEKLHNLFASSNIIRVIKSRRMRWAGHVTHIGEMRNVHSILVCKHERRDNSEGMGVGGRITLEWILKK